MISDGQRSDDGRKKTACYNLVCALFTWNIPWAAFEEQNQNVL